MTVRCIEENWTGFEQERSRKEKSNMCREHGNVNVSNTTKKQREVLKCRLNEEGANMGEVSDLSCLPSHTKTRLSGREKHVARVA
jgi:hypothetical protein